MQSQENTGQLLFQVQGFLKSSVTRWPHCYLPGCQHWKHSSLSLGHELISNNRKVSGDRGFCIWQHILQVTVVVDPCAARTPREKEKNVGQWVSSAWVSPTRASAWAKTERRCCSHSLPARAQIKYLRKAGFPQKAETTTQQKDGDEKLTLIFEFCLARIQS